MENDPIEAHLRNCAPALPPALRDRVLGRCQVIGEMTRERRHRRVWRWNGSLAQSALRSRRWRFAVCGLAVFLTVTLGGMYLWGSVQVNRELSAARSRGEALTLTEMAPAVPDAQNASTLYLQADAALRLNHDEETALNAHNTTRLAPQTLAKNQSAIALIRQAAARPACRFPVDWGAPVLSDIKLDELSRMRRLASLIRAQAAQETQKGQTAQALRDVGVIFRMSEHLSAEPTLISMLVSLAIEKTGYSALQKVLARNEVTEAQARQFERQLPQTDWNAVFTRSLYGERAFGIGLFDYARTQKGRSQALLSEDATSNYWFQDVRGLLWLPISKWDELVYLRAMEETIAASRLAAPNPLPDSTDPPRYAYMTKTLMPFFVGAGGRRDEAIDFRRLAQVALALAAYRATHGRYPDRLSAVQQANGSPLPKDLFTDQAFVYTTGSACACKNCCRPEGESFALYSVGPNRIDDTGMGRDGIASSGKGQKGDQKDDIVWSSPQAK